MITETSEKVIESLIVLLESGIGYQITFFGNALTMYELEDGRFSVNRQHYNSETRVTTWEFEELFEDAREAVEFFERKRQEYQLGFDIEYKLNKEAGLI